MSSTNQDNRQKDVEGMLRDIFSISCNRDDFLSASLSYLSAFRARGGRPLFVLAERDDEYRVEKEFRGRTLYFLKEEDYSSIKDTLKDTLNLLESFPDSKKDRSTPKIPDSLETLVPFIRSILNRILSKPKAPSPYRFIHVSPRIERGDVGLVFILVNDMDGEATFSYLLDQEWMDAMEKHGPGYEESNYIELLSDGFMSVWSTTDPDTDRWISCQVYRNKTPMLERYPRETEENKGAQNQSLARFEEKTFPKESYIYQVPIFLGKKMLGICASIFKTKESGIEGICSLILRVIYSNYTLFRMALFKVQERDFQEKLWFIQHNLNPTYLIPIQGHIEAALDKIQDDKTQGDISKRLQLAYNTSLEFAQTINYLIGSFDREDTGQTFYFLQEFRKFLIQVLPGLIDREIDRKRRDHVYIKFLGDFPDEFPEEKGEDFPLRCDPGTFRMALSVITVNALRAIDRRPEEGGLDRPGLTFTLARQGLTTLGIIDDGIGMEEPRRRLINLILMGRVTQFSLDMGRFVTGWQGTGVGLYTAGRVLRPFKGSIKIAESRTFQGLSREEQGRSFREGGPGSRVEMTLYHG